MTKKNNFRTRKIYTNLNDQEGAELDFIRALFGTDKKPMTAPNVFRHLLHKFYNLATMSNDRKE